MKRRRLDLRKELLDDAVIEGTRAAVDLTHLRALASEPRDVKGKGRMAGPVARERPLQIARTRRPFRLVFPPWADKTVRGWP